MKKKIILRDLGGITGKCPVCEKPINFNLDKEILKRKEELYHTKDAIWLHTKRIEGLVSSYRVMDNELRLKQIEIHKLNRMYRDMKKKFKQLKEMLKQ
jgi:DNA repair exonuclease SbcCD ATPase subunit